MACRLEWSPEAIEDIESIASYIERDSPWFAQIIYIVPALVVTHKYLKARHSGRDCRKPEHRDVNVRFN
jgi:plasmid stabilization system protein ParE